jgi:hypothetical protein
MQIEQAALFRGEEKGTQLVSAAAQPGATEIQRLGPVDPGMAIALGSCQHQYDAERSIQLVAHVRRREPQPPHEHHLSQWQGLDV